MRILVFIHEYPPLGGGGGKAAQDISKGLVAKGHEVVVITAWLPGLKKQEIDQGVKVIRLPSLRREAYFASFFTMMMFIIAAVWHGRKWIQKWQPDVLHAQFALPGGPVAFILSGIYKIPYILSSHLGDIPGGSPEKTGPWFRWVYPFTPPIWRRASKVVTVSEFTKQLAQKHYSVPMVVIPNGAQLRKVESEMLRPHSPVQIAFAGRFVHQKYPQQVIHVLHELKDLDWQCTMFGDGELHQEVKRLIDQLGLQDHFHLPGWVKPEQVISTFQNSDILFMPSRVEGLPVVGVQALTAGLAIVAGRAGGFIDLVEHGKNGFLFDSEDKDQFITSLRNLISDPDRLYKARQESMRVAQRFGIEHIVEQYEQLFKDSMAK